MMKVTTPWEISVRVSRRLGIPQTMARSAIEVACEEIAAALERGAGARLPGLGTLVIRETAARQTRNLRTGEPLSIPARRQVAFVQSTAMKAALKESR